MISFKGKSQGEIFGIALLFVVIIVGVIVYGKIKAVNGLDEGDLRQEGEYKILAEGTLNTITELSTGCYVQRDKNSVKDLINYCLENEFAGVDPKIKCDGYIGDVPSCGEVIDILNETLLILYNSSEGIGNIPYELYVDIPDNNETMLSNLRFTNFNDYEYKGVKINESNRRKYSFKRAPSGLISWSTAQRAIEMELYLYYR